MAEGDAFRIPAVFSADANLKPGPGLPPSLDPDVDQFAYPVRVDARKGVFLEDPTLFLRIPCGSVKDRLCTFRASLWTCSGLPRESPRILEDPL